MNPTNMQDNEVDNNQLNNGLTEPQDDPVSCARQIVQIEASLKEEISAIQEILAMIVQNKVDLDKIKEMTKEKLTTLANEEE